MLIQTAAWRAPRGRRQSGKASRRKQLRASQGSLTEERGGHCYREIMGSKVWHRCRLGRQVTIGSSGLRN